MERLNTIQQKLEAANDAILKATSISELKKTFQICYGISVRLHLLHAVIRDTEETDMPNLLATSCSNKPKWSRTSHKIFFPKEGAWDDNRVYSHYNNLLFLPTHSLIVLASSYKFSS